MVCTSAKTSVDSTLRISTARNASHQKRRCILVCSRTKRTIASAIMRRAHTRTAVLSPRSRARGDRWPRQGMKTQRSPRQPRTLQADSSSQLPAATLLPPISPLLCPPAPFNSSSYLVNVHYVDNNLRSDGDCSRTFNLRSDEFNLQALEAQSFDTLWDNCDIDP